VQLIGVELRQGRRWSGAELGRQLLHGVHRHADVFI
jgi:hypothetical protein